MDLDILILHTIWTLTFSDRCFSLGLLDVANNFIVFKVVFTMTRCINCLIAIPVTQSYQYNATNLITEAICILEEWVVKQVDEEDFICQECFNLLIIELNNREEGNIGERQLGHDSVCMCCGISIARRTGRRSHTLYSVDAEYIYIGSIISPLQMQSNARACYTCWVRARAHCQAQPAPEGRPITSEETSRETRDIENQDINSNILQSGSSSDIDPASPASIYNDYSIPGEKNVSLTLEGYSRTPDTSSHCIIPVCINPERKRMPLSLKKNILVEHMLYITLNARVCEEHLSLSNWDILNNFEFATQFNKKHIIEMLDLLRKDVGN